MTKETIVSRVKGVGKKIGGRVYLHKSALKLIPKDIQTWIKDQIKDHLGTVEYDIVSFDANGNLSLMQAYGWDTIDEPLIIRAIKIGNDGKIKVTDYSNRDNVPIYHHKWMFVSPDYKGFDVTESKRRSIFWQSHPVVQRLKKDDPSFKSKIGYSKYWDALMEMVVKEGLTVEDVTAGRTAKSRNVLSVPMRFALDNNLLVPVVYDFGCGRGDDVRLLSKIGIPAIGYDLYHAPETPPHMAPKSVKTVTCIFVLNVREPKSRYEVIVDIYRLVIRLGIHAIFAVRSTSDIANEKKGKSGWEKYEDGWITPTGSFQKGYTKDELVYELSMFDVVDCFSLPGKHICIVK